MAADTYDLTEAAGARLPWLVVASYGYGEPEGVYLSEFMDEAAQEGWWYPCGEITAHAQTIWADVRRCCSQAERMMALQATPERAMAILEEHRQGLIPLYKELKAELQKVGIRFAPEE